MTAQSDGHDGTAFERAWEELSSVRTALCGAIVGQDALVDGVLIALLAGGHVLVEGLPGLGKTQLAKSVASGLGLGWGRVQCTPDLMPADLTGSDVYVGDRSPGDAFQFQPGPLFAPLVLVDEINRATPRTQAALLEAMEERQVTCGGRRHALPRPFCVIATQNPIELEGTFPLPEAQLDRFLLKLTVPYPDAAALRRVLDVALDREPAASIGALLAPQRLFELLALVREVIVPETCKQAAVDLVLATQPAAAGSARLPIRYGASPRALQALVRTARARALLEGRAHVARDDLAALALPVLRHRILLELDAELEGRDADTVLATVLDRWAAAR